MSTAQKPIRVLHLLYSSLPIVAGYTIRSAYLLQSLRAQGVEVFAATVPDFGERAGTETIEGITYDRWSASALGPSWSWIRHVPSFRNRYRADREEDFYAGLAQRVGAQIIHSHSTARCGLIGARVAARLRLPYVYEVRGLWDESAIAEGLLVPGSLEHDLRRRQERRAVQAADRVVAISEALKSHLIAELGADPARCVVVPNGVDAEKFHPWTGENPLGGDPRLGSGPVIGYVGSLRRMEGLDLAVGAMRRLRERVPELRLVIVGDGPEREPLSRRAAELGVSDRVVMVGPVPHAEVLAWYDRIDLFIVPRIDQTVTQLITPLKPLEAMAAGRPVLVSDVGGLRELVADPGRGWTFHAGDEDDFVEKTASAVSDAAGLRAAGERARTWVETERTWQSVASLYLPVYRDLATSPPRDSTTRRRRMRPAAPPGRWVAAWSLFVGAAILALSRIPGPAADPYVQGLLISQVVIYIASHWLSRRALEGDLFRAAADTFFDVGFGASLLGLAAWTHPSPMPVHRLPLTLFSVGALCMLSASQVGFFLIGKREQPAFWSTTRGILALGTAVLSTIRMDFWPLLFVLSACTTASALHAAYVWSTSPLVEVRSAPVGDPAARIAKPRDNIVDKLVFRPISRRISLPLARMGVSPNVVTCIAVAFGAAAAWSLSYPDLPTRIAGVVFLQLSFLMDCVDGEIARAQGRVSPFGAWFDWMADRLVLLLAILGLALGATTEHKTALIWAATLTLLACEIFPRSFRDKTSFVGAMRRTRLMDAHPGLFEAFHRWRERRGMGMSLGTGALILVIGMGVLLRLRLETLIFLTVVRGLALLYKLASIVRELE